MEGQPYDNQDQSDEIEDNYDLDDFIQEDISETSLNFVEEDKPQQQPLNSPNDFQQSNIQTLDPQSPGKPDHDSVMEDSNINALCDQQSLQKLETLKELRRDLRIQKTKSLNINEKSNVETTVSKVRPDLNDYKFDQSNQQQQHTVKNQSQNISLKPLRKPLRPRLQSSKVYNRTPQILGSKPIKLRQNQVSMKINDQNLQSEFHVDSNQNIKRVSDAYKNKPDIHQRSYMVIRQNSQAILNTQTEPHEFVTIIDHQQPKVDQDLNRNQSSKATQSQNTFFRTTSKRKFMRKNSANPRQHAQNSLNPNQRRPSANRKLKQIGEGPNQLVFQNMPKGGNPARTQSQFHKPGGIKKTMIKQNELIIDQKQKVGAKDDLTNVQLIQSDGFRHLESQSFASNKAIIPQRPKRPQMQFQNCEQFDQMLDSLFGEIQKDTNFDELRASVNQKYDIQSSQISQQRHFLQQQRTQRNKALRLNLNRAMNQTKTLKLQARTELQLLHHKDLCHGLSRLHKDWIFSLLVDTEKNICFAKQKMEEQRQEFLQALEYNNRINQLEIYDELLQAQENLPLVQLSKMKRGKGVKVELKQLISKEFYREKGDRPIQEVFELELLAVLRRKPYVKKGANEFSYRLQSKQGKFPSVAEMLKMMPQIISGAEFKKIRVSVIKEKVSKKMKKYWQKKAQAIEVQKLEKLEQIVQNKQLKMFQGVDTQSLDVRVFKGRGQEVCRVKDLIKTKAFKNYFQIEGYKSDAEDTQDLFVLEKRAESKEKQQYRKLTGMEVCFLILIHFNVLDDADMVQKWIELKINQNSDIFAHKFKNRNGNQKSNLFQNHRYLIINQVNQTDSRIFKQFLVQAKLKKTEKKEVEMTHCSWPQCTHQTPLNQEQLIRKPRNQTEGEASNPADQKVTRNILNNQQNTNEVKSSRPSGQLQFIPKKPMSSKRRPDSAYKKNKAHVTSSNFLQLGGKRPDVRLSKLPFQIELDLKESSIIKIIRKYQAIKQTPQEREIARQKIIGLQERREQRMQGQLLHHQILKKSGMILPQDTSNFLSVGKAIFQQFGKGMPPSQPSFCKYHTKEINFIRINFTDTQVASSFNMVHMNPKLSTMAFWRIISNENYRFWKDDLRGCLSFDLFNGMLHEIFGKIALNIVNHHLKISQPSISPIIDCLQSQPQSLGILEQYAIWINQFVNKSDKKLLLVKNDGFEFTINQFLEQSQIFLDNMKQALTNEAQISEVLATKMLFVNDYISLDTVLKQKAMIRQLYPRIYDLICNSNIQQQTTPANKTLDKTQAQLFKNQQDVFLKFTKFQLILDYFTQFEQSQGRQNAGQYNTHGSNKNQQQASSGLKQMQQIYSNKATSHQNSSANSAFKAYAPIATLPEINKDFPQNLGPKQFQSPHIQKNHSTKLNYPIKGQNQKLQQIYGGMQNSQLANHSHMQAQQQATFTHGFGGQFEQHRPNTQLSSAQTANDDLSPLGMIQNSTSIQPNMPHFSQAPIDKQRFTPKKQQVSQMSNTFYHKPQQMESEVIYRPDQQILEVSGEPQIHNLHVKKVSNKKRVESATVDTKSSMNINQNQHVSKYIAQSIPMSQVESQGEFQNITRQKLVNFYSSATSSQGHRQGQEEEKAAVYKPKGRYQDPKGVAQTNQWFVDNSEKQLQKVQGIYQPKSQMDNQILIKKSRAHSMKKVKDQQSSAATVNQAQVMPYAISGLNQPLFQNRKQMLKSSHGVRDKKANQVHGRNMSSHLASQNPQHLLSYKQQQKLDSGQIVGPKKARPITSGGVSLMHRQDTKLRVMTAQESKVGKSMSIF